MSWSLQRDTFGNKRWLPDHRPVDGSMYPHVKKSCPHQGCDWELTVEYRSKSVFSWRSVMPAQLRDRLQMEHLESHLDPTLKELKL